MAKIQLGYKRLYDSLGLSLQSQEEFSLSFPLGIYHIGIYIGPKPPLGVGFHKNPDKYLLFEKGHQVRWDFEYKADATESTYPRKFFTEIVCVKEVDIDDSLYQSFNSDDKQALEQLLDLAENEKLNLLGLIEVVGGTLGLRYQRQFVMELIQESPITFRSNGACNFRGYTDAIEVLESIAITDTGLEGMKQLFPQLDQSPIESLLTASVPLFWLRKAWVERDFIATFMAYFTAIEVALNDIPAEELSLPANQMIEQIEKILEEHGGTNKHQLIEYIQKLEMKRFPKIERLFKTLASKHQLPGWEHDIHAFQKFNYMRNLLLHRGDVHTIQSRIAVTEADVRDIKDLSEKYVSLCLYGDGQVYYTRWRNLPKQPVETLGC